MLGPLRAAPQAAAVLTDFDGTLAPIVDDPWTAEPLPGVVEALEALASRYAVVGVISGRPVQFLLDRLGGRLWLSGLYGLETVRAGRPVTSPQAERWRPVVAATTAAATAAWGGAVEDKGVSLTIHFRTDPEWGAAVRAWAAAEAARTGLEVRNAKASVEVHPPVGADKGTVVEEAVRGLAAACFLGDDVGDLPAFDALDRLAAGSFAAVKVGVRTPEAPPTLLARADIVVEGPAGALELLRSLL